MSCKHHLAIDVTEHGSITLTKPEVIDGELDAMQETCALDVADNYPQGLTLDGVGVLMNVSRERIRQIEARATLKLKRGARRADIEDPPEHPRSLAMQAIDAAPQQGYGGDPQRAEKLREWREARVARGGKP